MSLLASRIAALGTENAFKVGEDIARAEARGMKVIRFNLGEPDFDTPAHINRVAMDQIAAGNSHYCDPAGIRPFRVAIARHLERTRGIPADPERIVVTPGAKPPIGYAMQTYVEPGDEVIYPSPGFPIYESWVTYLGARPVPLMLREERDFSFTAGDLAALLSRRTKLIILNSPSNPTGGVLSRGDLAEIAAVLAGAGSDVRVYSDEVYEHIVFDGEAHHSLASEPGMAARTILVSGHSKGFAMTGWRLGYALLPTREEAQVFKQLNINLISCVPPFVQEAGRAAYESPQSDPAVAAMVEAFQQRRDRVVAALAAIPGIRCRLPKGAFYVFPNVAGACERLGILDAYRDLPAAAAARTSPSKMLQLFLLYRYGVATMDRKSFGAVGADGQHFLRLSIAASMEALAEGLERIARAVEDRDGFAAFLAEDRRFEMPAALPRS